MPLLDALPFPRHIPNMKSPSPSPQNPPSRSPRRWTSCLAAVAVIGLSASAAFGQGSETFTNLPTASTTYLSRSWTGDNGVTWTAEGARTDQTITGKAICFGNSGNRTVTSPVYSGGMGTLSFNYTRAFTGTGARSLEVYVNGNKIGATITVSPTSNDIVAYNSDINIAGNVQLQIRSTGAAQVKLDDIVWTTGGSDTTAPTILTYAPANGAVDVPLTTTELVANFSENVAKGLSGNITLKLNADNSTAMTIDVTNPAVAVSGANATITLPASLATTSAYYVNIDAGAFKDAANNNFAGISGNSTWAFTTATVDGTAPSVVTLSPADGSSNVLPTSNLVITYDEAILAGNGTVTIRKTSDASVVETLTVPGALVSVSGTTATLNPSTVLDYATGYYVEVSAGAFTDVALNNSTAISGAAAWNFTTRDTPAIVISQYYEGVGRDRYIELKNLSGSALPLDGYRVAAWSDTAPSDNEGWKSGTNTSTRVTDLAGQTIPANGTFLIAETTAAAPVYAKANNDLLDNGGCTAINGDDSVVLYQGAGFSKEEVVDAVSFTTIQGEDTSFYRLNNGVGFDFNTGSSILDFSGTWGTKTLAEVAGALPSVDWYLSATVPIGTLTLSIDTDPPGPVSESAGLAAATATVTRSGNTSEDLIVIIESNKPGVAYATTAASAPDPALSVTIPQNASSVEFDINTKDNPWLTGDNNVTFTVTTDRFLPASDTLTVQDDPSDLPYPVVINEIRVDDDLGDGFEYFELYNSGSVPVSLDNLSYIVIGDDAAGSSGVIENITALPTGVTLNPGEFYLVAKQASLPVDSDADGDQVADFTAIPDHVASGISFENSDNVTHLLVYGFSGSNDQDLDAEDDGILNSSPWTFIADGIGLVESITNPPTSTEWAYGASLGFVDLGPDGTFMASHVYRATDGGTWAIGPFGALQGTLPGGDNSVLADVKDTPGISNVPTPPGNNFVDWIDGFEVGLLVGFSDDFDKDGLANALENILGSSPAVPNQGLSAVSVSAGILKFRHTLAAEAAIADDLSFEYEWSADLTNWQASGVAAGGTNVTFGAPVVITPGTPDLVEVSATVTGTPASKIFARLRVDQVAAP